MASRKARKRKSDHDINSKRVNKVPKEKKKGISIPTLLQLPGKVRNKIWAHTFDYFDYVNCGRRIDITCFRHFPKMPSAPAVCCQMMAEVLGVFLNETKFVIWISDCEGKLDVPANKAYMKLCKLQHDIGKVDSAPTELSDAMNAPTYTIYGAPWLENIVKWAEAVHASELALTYDTDDKDRSSWVGVLFEILQTAVKLRGTPWEDVRQVCCSMGRIAGATSFEWYRGVMMAGSYDSGFSSSDMELGSDLDSEVSGESEW